MELFDLVVDREMSPVQNGEDPYVTGSVPGDHNPAIPFAAL